tara:strand:- start:521 stop:1168 length:648 start_codon:yes stop_codon:yes gene_type:complete
MVSLKDDCRKVFQKAYENRYTWPENFNGYKGRCILNENKVKCNGIFLIGKNYQPVIKNIENKENVKKISSQLFEVVIHRVKKSFEETHSKNQFQYLSQTEKGTEMRVLGKNDGDKYRVKDGKINMVFRKIHGIIIEIFVEDFFDTGNGVLSRKYSSQQLDVISLKPKSQKYKYLDNFIKIQNTDLWVLESRKISYLNEDKEELTSNYIFKDIKTI